MSTKKVGRPSNKYYVYLYLTPDGIPFYAGKGKNRRHKVQDHLYKSNSNPFLKRKIRKVGVDNVEVRFPHKDLTEEQAFYLEEYYIAGYGRRDLGLGPLCNLTNGGEGTSGYSHSNETKRKLRNAFKGRAISAEQKQKISDTLKGHSVSAGARQKMSAAKKGKSTWNKGKKMPNAQKQKISDAHKGCVHSAETKRKMSKSHKGLNTWSKGRAAWNKGIPCPDKTKQKIRATLKARDKNKNV